jgi:hypothetical protein
MNAAAFDESVAGVVGSMTMGGFLSTAIWLWGLYVKRSGGSFEPDGEIARNSNNAGGPTISRDAYGTEYTEKWHGELPDIPLRGPCGQESGTTPGER